MTRSISINDTLRRGSATAAVAALVLVVSGCGGSADKGAAAAPAAGKAPAAAGAVLEVSGAEFAFAPAKLKASAGKTTIRFSNKGVMEHDFTIDALKIKLSAAAGKTAETTVTLAPGTYNSLCTVPGHLTSGMKGTLTVS